MLRKEQISSKVWVIYGTEQPDVARAFVRFQEYYENAKLKGERGLVVNDIDKWWEQHRDKDEKELYYTYWVGFNVPGKVILDLIRSCDFRSGFSVTDFLAHPNRYPRWHNDETEFLGLLEDLTVDQINESYFVGMWQESTDVLDHEIAHAFFATISAYKAEQMWNISQFPKDLYKDISGKLIDLGYHPDVINDEVQAYLSSYIDTLSDTFDTDAYNDYVVPFVETLTRYRSLHTPS